MSDSIDADIERCKELDAKATKGPWVSSIGGYQILTGDSWNTVCVFHEGSGDKWKDHRAASWEGGDEPELLNSNADLIAEYRTLAPRLATACEELKAERDYEKQRADFAAEIEHGATMRAAEAEADVARAHAALGVAKAAIEQWIEWGFDGAHSIGAPALATINETLKP